MFFRLPSRRTHPFNAHNFAVTARLAWDCERAGDPDLATWLVDENWYAEHGNGIVLFAPRLLARAKVRGITSPLGILKGAMRWRHATNSYLNQAIGEAIVALSDIGPPLVISGGWADVARGTTQLADAHMLRTDIATGPVVPEAIERRLHPLGWRKNGRHWSRHDIGGTRDMTVARLVIAPAFDLPPELSNGAAMPAEAGDANIHYLKASGETFLLSRQLIGRREAVAKRQSLDRLAGLLPDANAVDTFQKEAFRHGHDKLARNALRLYASLCGGPFRASFAMAKRDSP